MKIRLFSFSGLILTLVLLLALLVAAAVSIITVAELRDKALNRVLAPYGLHSVQTVLSLDALPDDIQFHSIAFSYDDQGQMATAELHNVSLSKTVNDAVWLQPRAWNVTIDRLVMSISIAADSEDQKQEAALAKFEPLDWLPQSILQQVPLNKLAVDSFDIQLQQTEQPPWRVKGGALATAELIQSSFAISHQQNDLPGLVTISEDVVNLSIGDLEKPWLNLQTRLATVDQRLVAGGSYKVNNPNEIADWSTLIFPTPPDWLLWSGSLDGTFSINVEKRVLDGWLNQAMIEPENIYQGLVVSGEFEADIQLPRYEDLASDVDYRGSGYVQLHQGSLKLKPLTVAALSMDLNAQHALIKELANPLVGDASMLSAAMNLQGDLTYALEAQDLTLDVAQGRLALGPSRGNLNSTLYLKNLSVLVEQKNLQKVVGASLLDIALLDKPALKGVTSVKADRVDQDIVGQLKVTLEDLTELNTDFDYNPKTQSIEFTVNSQRASLATETFNEWADKFSLPLALELGDMELTMQGQVNLKDLLGVTTQGNVVFEGWQGKLEKNYFSSLDSPFNFSGNLSQFKVEAEVTNGLFDVGIPITDIHYFITIEGSVFDEKFDITLKNLEGNLIGGTVRIPELQWDSETQATDFHVVISDWQFSEMIKLLERDDLEVTGTLDGMLPVVVQKDGVLIKDGLLTARKPGGVIRYNPDTTVKDMLKSQQELKMATDILENFHYEQLDVELNQDIEFNQYLTLTLKGSNPKAYGGTPVNLNLNIEHNILPLIQSLTLPGKVQEHWNELDKLQ